MVTAALDLDFVISEDARRKATRAVISQLIEFVVENPSEADLRARHAEGVFESALIAWHARSILESRRGSS